MLMYLCTIYYYCIFNIAHCLGILFMWNHLISSSHYDLPFIFVSPQFAGSVFRLQFLSLFTTLVSYGIYFIAQYPKNTTMSSPWLFITNFLFQCYCGWSKVPMSFRCLNLERVYRFTWTRTRIVIFFKIFSQSSSSFLFLYFCLMFGLFVYVVIWEQYVQVFLFSITRSWPCACAVSSDWSRFLP